MEGRRGGERNPHPPRPPPPPRTRRGCPLCMIPCLYAVCAPPPDFRATPVTARRGEGAVGREGWGCLCFVCVCPVGGCACCVCRRPFWKVSAVASSSRARVFPSVLLEGGTLSVAWRDGGVRGDEVVGWGRGRACPWVSAPWDVQTVFSFHPMNRPSSLGGPPLKRADAPAQHVRARRMSKVPSPERVVGCTRRMLAQATTKTRLPTTKKTIVIYTRGQAPRYGKHG